MLFLLGDIHRNKSATQQHLTTVLFILCQLFLPVFTWNWNLPLPLYLIPHKQALSFNLKQSTWVNKCIPQHPNGYTLSVFQALQFPVSTEAIVVMEGSNSSFSDFWTLPFNFLQGEICCANCTLFYCTPDGLYLTIHDDWASQAVWCLQPVNV